MWWFDTKKWLLESIWKRWDDTRLFDRMLKRDEVYRGEDWKWYLRDTKDSRISELLDRIVELEQENEWLGILVDWYKEDLEKLKKEKSENKGTNDKTVKMSVNSTWEMSDLDYAIKAYEDLEATMDKALHKCYNEFVKMKKIDPNLEKYDEWFRWVTS